MNRSHFSLYSCGCSALVLLGLGVLSAASMRVNAEEDAGKLATIEEVNVTSTRVKARPGYEAPTPTTVLGSEFVSDMSTPNVADALNRLPSMGNANSPRSNGNNTSTPTQGANFLNLRGLGTNRTLVLLDGRRVVGAAVTGQVDLNLLPSTLLQRTEVVTGGASAAWGSDAVAGVVNLVLDKEFTGFKGSIQLGTSDERDADERKANFAGGFEFADGRGHVLASVNYTESDSVDRADSRDWFRGTKLVNNPAYAPGNGEPQRLVLDNVGQFIGSDAGHTFLSAGPLAGITFAPDGSLQNFDFGTRFPGQPLGTSLTGDGQLNDFSARSALQVGYEQVNTFLRASFDVTDKINVYGEYIYANTEAETVTVPYYRFAGALTINRDNAFLPADLATQMDNFGMTSIPLGRSNVDFGRANPYNDRDFSRIVLGAEISLSDNWSLETYYERGETDIHAEVRSNANRANYALAVDAVDDGSGNIVCRSTLTDPTNGCVAANIFGLGAPSQAAIDYVIGAAVQDTTVTQDVFSVTVQGDLLTLPAGPVSAAFGYEYRKEEFTSKADPLSLVNGWWVGNYKSAKGEYDVNEFFAEIVVPVFVDSALGESFDLNAAVRATDYSTSGDVNTWKLGFTYNIGAGVSLRGTKSRDIRAPNLNEYFSGGETNSIFFDDPFTGQNSVLVPRTISGNTDLQPEEADTKTVGIVYQPEFVEGLVVSLDYFDIEIGDAINAVDDQSILDRCFQGETAFCSLIERDSSGNLARVFNGPVNFAVEKLSGYDLEIGYGFDAAGGRVDIRTLWTYTDEHFTVDRGDKDDLLGEYAGGNGAFAGGPQERVGFTSVRYSTDRYTLSLRNRYVGDGVIDAQWTSGVDVDNNKVNSVSYFDLSASADIQIGGSDAEIFFSVDNIFDKEPPRVGFDGPTALDDLGVSGSRHDLIGRYFRAGLRFAF
ncbi:MAG: TonB-dependent receptor [Gammaproteobacteria bacterium]|nr:TonB-dependent receptor [Gammaproteobacteria bacterium]